MARVAIIDDHALLAESLAGALNRGGHDATVIDLTDPDRIVLACREADCDLVLVDLHLGDRGSAQPTVRALVEAGREVVVLTGVTDPIELAEVLEAGARGVIGKSVDLDVLLAEVEGALNGGPIAPPASERARWEAELAASRLEQKNQRADFDRLTPREQAVLARLMTGMAAAEIADVEYVSIETVRSQIKAIRQKLGVPSQLAAVTRANHAGWIPPRPTDRCRPE